MRDWGTLFGRAGRGTRAIHHLIPTAAPTDAVTTQALAWQSVMKTYGVEGHVFAEHIHPAIVDRVGSLESFQPGPNDGVVLHYSIWSPVVTRALKVSPDRVAVHYQNITPGHFLEATNPHIAALCDLGRQRLALLNGRVIAAITPSRFNARDLEAVGLSDVRIVPLFVPLKESRSTARPDPTRVITIGRVVPNKRLEDAIRGVAALRAGLIPGATLDIVGSWEGFERYHQSLVAFVERLRLSEAVTFHGQVSDDNRDRLYDRAGAYLCTSEHEGFCVPLIEALLRGVPVVARAAGAVPETLGGAGVVLPDADPLVCAEALSCVLTDVRVRAGLATLAARRLAQLRPERVEAQLIDALAPLLR